MLERPDPSPSERRRRRYRARRAAGIAVAPVEYNGDVINFLIRSRWLQEAEVYDRGAVGRAISRMLAVSARR
jgi:hypothetical protein